MHTQKWIPPIMRTPQDSNGILTDTHTLASTYNCTIEYSPNTIHCQHWVGALEVCSEWRMIKFIKVERFQNKKRQRQQQQEQRLWRRRRRRRWKENKTKWNYEKKILRPCKGSLTYYCERHLWMRRIHNPTNIRTSEWTNERTYAIYYDVHTYVWWLSISRAVTFVHVTLRTRRELLFVCSGYSPRTHTHSYPQVICEKK